MDDKDSKYLRKCLKAKGYELDQYLGQGKTGVVFRAWDHEDLSYVAVKVVEKKKVPKKYYTTNLPLEISVWEEIRHSNIVRLLDYGSNTTCTYTIMEYSPNDLDSWLMNHDRVGEDLSRRWVRQLTCALHHLKKLGYSHGDVKPKNILVFRGRSIKLCDFSCMKSLNEGLCEVYYGSPGYVAPEVFDMIPHDCEKADVWSYGITGYNLLTHGIVKQKKVTTFVMKLKKNFEDILPLESQSLFRGALQKCPEKRFDFDDILQHPWICTFPTYTPSSTRSTPQPSPSSSEESVDTDDDDDCSTPKKKKGPAKPRRKS